MMGVALFAVLWALPGGSVSYLATQGYYQAKLLWGRESVTGALGRPDVPPAVKRQLERVLDIRTFGEQRLHLKPTENYTTVNLAWSQEIWNVSACRELEFRPYTWWFPVVGTVPYKGFFRKADAELEASRLQGQGYETALRRVGGYSTLGWFRDPILPNMLSYPEGVLASLVLHELAHATLFIPGRIDFNESFASFVGDEAALRYLEARHGVASPEYRETKARHADEELFNRFMHGLYERLDGIYRSDRPDGEKRRLKEAAWAEAGRVYVDVPFQSERYRGRHLERLNNADLLQFRRYSSARAQFAAVLAAQQGDMSRFFAVFEPIARSGEDPFDALTRLATSGPEVLLSQP
jgi:predicted aminopeptidase